MAESAFIGASILLAFALQDWDEAKDIEERMLIALCNVRSELEFNRLLIETDYVPRQQGMLAVTQASMSLLRAAPSSENALADLKQMQLQESLRYSAWRLAGESGYLLHANFQLATEMGAIFDYQEDRYQRLISRVNDALMDREGLFQKEPLNYYVKVTALVGDLIAQTNYLQQKYKTLFEREDLRALQCEP